MKTIVKGKKIKRNYEVKINKDGDGKFTSKPTIDLIDEDIKWEEILSYDDKPQSHSGSHNNWFQVSFSKHISLSEDEEVEIEKEKFRADLGCWIQYVDKELDVKDNMKKCEKELVNVLKEYNTQMIEDNPKAKAYCDLHKLNYAETDYEELMEIIEPKEKVTITTNDINLRGIGVAPLTVDEFKAIKFPF